MKVGPGKLFNLLQFTPQTPVVVDTAPPDEYEKSHIRQSRCFAKLTTDTKANSSVVIVSRGQVSEEQVQTIERRLPNTQRPVGVLTVSTDLFRAQYPFLFVKASDDPESVAYNQAAMRYPLEAVDGFLWVGDLIVGSNMSMLARLGITDVLDCSPNGVPGLQADMEKQTGQETSYMHLPPSNLASTKLSSAWLLEADDLLRAVEFVSKAQTRKGRCLVFDFEGTSLSAAVAAAYKLVTSGKGAPWCVTWVRSRSAKLEITKPQIAQLIALDDLL